MIYFYYVETYTENNHTGYQWQTPSCNWHFFTCHWIFAKTSAERFEQSRNWHHKSWGNLLGANCSRHLGRCCQAIHERGCEKGLLVFLFKTLVCNYDRVESWIWKWFIPKILNIKFVSFYLSSFRLIFQVKTLRLPWNQRQLPFTVNIYHLRKVKEMKASKFSKKGVVI